MGRRLRIYHPEYRVRWFDQLVDLFGGAHPAPRPAGPDYTLLNRAAMRTTRAFLDGAFSVVVLGDEMVRIDSSWALPDGADAQMAACEALVLRLRFGQVHPNGLRVAIPARWFEFNEAAHGTRVLVRLLQRPDPALRSFLVGNLSETGDDEWAEYAVGAD